MVEVNGKEEKKENREMKRLTEERLTNVSLKNGNTIFSNNKTEIYECSFSDRKPEIGSLFSGGGNKWALI